MENFKILGLVVLCPDVHILAIAHLISEIKEVKKKKEKAKELEGIDMSNIVMSSRRRSTTSFVPPPKPKIPVDSDSDAEDTDDDNDEEDEEVEDEDNSSSDDNHSDKGKCLFITSYHVLPIRNDIQGYEDDNFVIYGASAV